MLRQLIELRTGPLTGCEFRELMILVTRDIKVKHLSCGQRTCLDYLIHIAVNAHPLARDPSRLLKGKLPKSTISQVPKSWLKGVI